MAGGGTNAFGAYACDVAGPTLGVGHVEYGSNVAGDSADGEIGVVGDMTEDGKSRSIFQSPSIFRNSMVGGDSFVSGQSPTRSEFGHGV